MGTQLRGKGPVDAKGNVGGPHFSIHMYVYTHIPIHLFL